MQSEIQIINARSEHAAAMYDVGRLGYSVPLTEECSDCPGPHSLPQVLERFPEGQFVAVDGETVVGYGVTMVTHHAPEDQRQIWHETIGDMTLVNHDPAGDWLYLVDFVVHPGYQGRGVGKKLFRAAMELSQRLGLKGCYGGGMLSGYYLHSQDMSLETYADRVRSGEMSDPTVTAEIRSGFEGGRLLRDYADYGLSANAAMLITWRNPNYAPR